MSSTTRGTVTFVFHFFLMLYTMFFLLMDGRSMLRALLNHLPLNDDDREQMTSRFMSVTRATVKGTIIIGIIQGGLAGLAFRVVGIPDALFWSLVMVVLSILPAIGGALVWVPACIILAANGEVMKAVLLAAFCALIVGSVDNLLRPRLVGRDTKMHDLVILFSTLGGILAFGPVGLHHRSDSRGAVRDVLGDLRRGVSRRASRRESAHHRRPRRMRELPPLTVE